ncbi:uncharacterized protein LOC131218627 isoform X2 [Magnolia sinica]|uniref:uncharacterized protein LOC131218627 isoform X2 n=1 Tax=Magnolia sinica TaxID=86752 RepID=UPI00265B6B03|nr:uncharacterized protein LOC131218627 isoform X2 [Magnolia sinica]
MSDGPKLYTTKPKKGQLKQKAKDFSTPAPNPSAMGPIPPPTPPKESFARRYKFVWPLLLAVNLAVGGYLFMRTKKKDTGAEDDEIAGETPAPIASTTALVPEKTSLVPPIAKPIEVRQPIPEHEQRELFKWMLEEKRKAKPSNPSEKKRIDEEKAILKQFIRSKSIPNF